MTDKDLAGVGHNSTATRAELANFAARLEHLKVEKAEQVAAFNTAIKEVRAECKGRGYDLKALDHVLKLRALDDEARSLVLFYGDVLGVLG